MQKTYQTVRAFTAEGFAGNEAAVFFPAAPELFADSVKRQQMAKELDAPATVFAFGIDKDRYRLFCHAPNTEIQFCGHGTLACAYTIFKFAPSSATIVCELNSVTVNARSISGECCELVAPARDLGPALSDERLKNVFPSAISCYRANGIDVLLLPSKQEVRAFSVPDEYCRNGGSYLAITASGEEKSQIFSRYFSLATEVKEDSVTGSLHFLLAPFWCRRLRVSELECFQLSSAGGYLQARLTGHEVQIRGRCSPGHMAASRQA